MFETADASLLDVIDHVLNQGVVLSGDIMLGVADVDLIHLRLMALACAADRTRPIPAGRPGGRRRRRT